MSALAGPPGPATPSFVQARRLAGEDAITELLRSWQQGEPAAAERVMELVYRELRHIAGRLLRGGARDATLSPTAIVHELYLKLEERGPLDWRDRAHFFALAARMMRQMLVDHCRAMGRSKRGGDRRRVALEGVEGRHQARPMSLLELDDALSDLARRNPRQAAVVELRYFGGLTIEESAECLGIAPKTVVREWRRARAWLFHALDARGRQNP